MTEQNQSPEEVAKAKAALDEQMKLTPEEEQELKGAAIRKSYVKDLDIQGTVYTIGTASHAADKFWNSQKVVARVVMRQQLRDDMIKQLGLDPKLPFPFFIAESDVDAAAIPDINTAYIATHLRQIDGTAMTYGTAKAAAEEMEGTIRGMLIQDIEAMYKYYKALLIKLQYGANAKKSSAPASSSTNS